MFNSKDIPPTLILKCNNPTAINVLSDFIEEQTGTTPIFHESGWNDLNSYNDPVHTERNYLRGNGRGGGHGNNPYTGDGYGNGIDYYGFNAILYNGDGQGGGYGHHNGNGASNGYTLGWDKI